MEQIKLLFSKDTKLGRTVRGAIQLTLSLLTFIIGLVSLPGFNELVSQNTGTAVATLVTINFVVTYIYNTLGSLLQWIVGDN